MDMTLKLHENLTTALDSVAENLLEPQDVLRIMEVHESIIDLEQYLDDVIEECGEIPDGEFDLFEMCGNCQTLLVWCPDKFEDDREAPPRGYRHVRTGLPDCDE